MSKVSFRARALDSNKPLPLYYEEELPDLSEYVAINRTVPQMPTGMEKEEESESHLQKVMNARQNLKDSSDLVIPIPEAAIPVNDHSTIYQKIRMQPHTYIRMPGLGPDEELPDYDLDSEDEEWLSVQSRERPLSPLHFERMMDRLEKGSGNTVLSDHDAQVLLKDDEDLVMAVYDYWLAKRLRLSRPLIPSVKNERRDGTSSSNPYLAFRKRTEKMQTRKNRKNDEHAYMHMLKLKRDLTRSVTLIELIKEREQRKYDHALIQAEIFRKRYLLQDWSGSLISSLKPHGTPTSSSGRRLSTPDNSKWDGKGAVIKGDYYDDNDVIVPMSNKRKKRRKGPMYTPTTMLDHESPLATIGLSKSDRDLKEADKVDVNEERIDVEELDGPFTFRRKIHLHYHKSQPFGTWPWDTPPTSDNLEHESSHRKKYCFSRTTLNGRHLGFSRRRVGRGGRSVWDYVPESSVHDSCDSSIFLPGSEGGGEHSRNDGNLLLPVDCDTAPSTPSRTPQEQTDNKPQSRCPHFSPASPKATSFIDFEFTYLPFVDPSSYPCPELNKGYSQFAGQTLNDEEEGVSSFSSLPTSQFTLRPCVNPDQSTSDDHLLDRSENDVCKEDGTSDSHSRVEHDLVWNKFRQAYAVPSATQNSLDNKSPSCSTSDNPSSSSSAAVSSLTVPSTHLSSLESGLPIQIHVNNLTHLPKKDAKATFPNTFCSSKAQSTSVTASSSSSNSHPLSSSVSLSSSSNVAINKSTDSNTGVPTTTVVGQSNKPPQSTKEVLVWFKDCPSSHISSLNTNSRVRFSKKNKFRCSLPPSIAKSVTARFKTEVKSEPLQAIPSIVPSISLPLSASSSSSPSSSSPLPHQLLSNQHQIVSSLINDPKKIESFVRDKRHLVTHAAAAVTAVSTANSSSTNHQNSSPNGTAAALEVNHSNTNSKLSSDSDSIKHTLAARTIVNNHSNLVDSSSGNMLVKLTSGTPPSEVT